MDETPDALTSLEIVRFLNIAPMGRGLGLEIGNTIHFDMPCNQFAYRTTDNSGRPMR